MRAVALVLLFLATATATASAEQPIPPSSAGGAIDDEPVPRESEPMVTKPRPPERHSGADHPPQESAARPVAVAAEDNAPRFRFGRGGFVIGTPDGKTELRIRAVLHLDGRAYFGGTQPIADTFLIRRARPFIEGTLFEIVEFRLMPDFAEGRATLQDGWVELRPWRWLRLRGGRFMVPIGLEWLQKDTTITFVERSLATDLVPYRDLGLMLSGDVADGTFAYAAAIVNGAPDSGNGPDIDPQSDKDYVARLFLRPLRRHRVGTWMDLGFGVAGSYGIVHGTAASSALPAYRSPGQQPIFSYITGAAGAMLATGPAPADAAVAAGARWRVTPQAFWYIGPLGLLGEYVVSSQRVQRMDAVADIQNRAWNLTVSLVLTLEHASYDGVVPKHPIDFRHKSFGALELTLRYSELHIDAGAFPTFADPAASVRSAREFAVGLNWYLTDYVKIMLSFHRTDFSGGAALDGDREPENTLLGRLQLAL
jgi:phosphate-selective porin OprO and OprP